ncbi:hypothetical protein [Raoultella sp. RIT712]|uniref:hypothetical protein n=1 Tax=unclassified Raoultella TaxID=2627600 RepID=UPI0012AD31D4|nr:hypothetical protein [Raoultella sp. RIT712]MRT47647.1 hypothetical protein [Raoultella sp. RIT712]
MIRYPIYDSDRQLSKETFIEFPVAKCINPKVIWRNDILISNHEHLFYDHRNGIDEWIINNYAYTSCTVEKNRNDFFMYCERYGGSGIGHNGGGARVALNGHFQAKGCGLTPLYSVFADDERHHSGCCKFSETIKEAIWGEVGALLFPHGAVRVLAIISFFNPLTISQSYISVRENSLRPAHFVRALYCKLLSRTENNKIDNVRTFKNINDVLLNNHIHDFIEITINKWADQAAFMHVNRIMHGAITPSNIALDGRMLDFGTMTSLGKHCAVITAYQKYDFWNEPDEFLNVLKEMLFSLHYYTDIVDGTYISTCTKKYWSRFEIRRKEYLFDMFGVKVSDSKLSDRLCKMIFSVFKKYQTETFHGVPKYEDDSTLEKVYSILKELSFSCKSNDLNPIETLHLIEHMKPDFNIDFLNVDVLDSEIGVLNLNDIAIYISSKVEKLTRSEYAFKDFK